MSNFQETFSSANPQANIEEKQQEQQMQEAIANPTGEAAIQGSEPEERVTADVSKKEAEMNEGDGFGSNKKRKERREGGDDDDAVLSSFLQKPIRAVKKNFKSKSPNMNKHSDKKSGEAFPTPNLSPARSPTSSISSEEQRGIEEAIPALLQLAERVIMDHKDDEVVHSTTRRALDFDLNDPHEPDVSAHPQRSPEVWNRAKFDLNLSPPSEDEDDV